MSNLTRAEKNAIIINEAKGIQHPDYYVCTTKTGKVQVRKRKVNLIKDEVTKVEEEPKSVEVVKEPESKESVYETITNKQLMEKMLQVLEKTTESKDKNLNAPENERMTEDNKQFVEGIRDKVIKDKISDKVSNDKVDDKSSDKVSNDKVKVEQQPRKMKTARNARTLINNYPRNQTTKVKKGRILI